MIKNLYYKSRMLPYFMTILILGCTTGIKPTASPVVSSAETALESAINSGGQEYAPIEIKMAQEKMISAHHALKEKDFTAATNLANEAKIYALRAEEKADSAQTKNNAKVLREYIQILLHELSHPKQKN